MRIAVVDVAAIPRHEYRGIEFESEHSSSMEDHWSDAYKKRIPITNGKEWWIALHSLRHNFRMKMRSMTYRQRGKW